MALFFSPRFLQCVIFLSFSLSEALQDLNFPQHADKRENVRKTLPLLLEDRPCQHPPGELGSWPRTWPQGTQVPQPSPGGHKLGLNLVLIQETKFTNGNTF